MSACIGYILFFQIFFNNAFCYMKLTFMCNARFKTIILALFVVLPLSFVKTFTNYTKYSFVANILIAFSLLITIGYSLI